MVLVFNKTFKRAVDVNLNMVFNDVPMTDAELIQLHGGSTALARKLNMLGLNGSRRVNNWKRRGIPAKVKLENPWLVISPNWPNSSGGGRGAAVRAAGA
ncbi:MAG: hypothetical protein WBC18_14690 [Ottowia sp.]|uniref:hypothetical protein n=1 Tax=Ottowia sp. TaxID=1898956 RepID=UPI003C72983E